MNSDTNWIEDFAFQRKSQGYFDKMVNCDVIHINIIARQNPIQELKNCSIKDKKRIVREEYY